MRKLKEGILKGICKYCQETEIPSIFALWSGIICISASLGRDVFLDMGHYTVWPNLYTVLVAGSARCRKSTAINVASKFINKVKPPIKVLSQKMTAEALIGSLSGMTAQDRTNIISEAEGIFVADELSTLINAKSFSSGMIEVLTKLYDGTRFEYETRSRGPEIVDNPCLSIFGGSTLDWIKAAIPTESIGGGFTSRIVFVYQESFEKLIAWPTMSEENTKRAEEIARDLCEVSKMRGSFAFSDSARALYEKEYIQFRKDSPLFESPGLSGYAGRRHTTLQKICMIVSASSGDSRIVNEGDVQVAMNVLKHAEVSMPKVLRAISSELAGSLMEEVVQIVKRRKMVTRPELLRRMRHKITAKDLDYLMDTLLQAGAIVVETEGHTTKYVYVKE